MISGMIFAPVPGGGQNITTGETSAKATNPAPQGVRVVLISTTEDAYIRFGLTGDAATSSDMRINAAWGATLWEIPDGGYVHALQASTSGVVRVHWMIGR